MLESERTENDCPEPQNFLPKIARNPENCAMNVASKRWCSYRFFYSPKFGGCYCELPYSNCSKVAGPNVTYNQYRLFRGMNNLNFIS